GTPSRAARRYLDPPRGPAGPRSAFPAGPRAPPRRAPGAGRSARPCSHPHVPAGRGASVPPDDVEEAITQTMQVRRRLLALSRGGEGLLRGFVDILHRLSDL